VPRVFRDPVAQLNPCEENRCHQKRDENAPDKFTGTRRSYSKTQERSNAHLPQKTEIRFGRLQHFFCALPNRSRIKQQLYPATNSSADELTAIGRVGGCRSRNTESTERTFALLTLDRSPKNASVYRVKKLTTV